MGKFVQTFILWFSVPLLAIVALVMIANGNWQPLLIILLVLASPLIVGFLYGVIQVSSEWSDREARRLRRDAETARRDVHQAFLPDAPEAPAADEPAKPPSRGFSPKRPFGHQWRA
ncbi:hypothetical protein [Sandarakinorhabdus oryzae]|uniref:hypothetical protein n=1 Tax=Sandarakinorhabdus oryzae TaxID=2675220 RepID=UPI0012E22500|nr:hypothetical protein [Sandarakinorhabdus oryzae]